VAESRRWRRTIRREEEGLNTAAVDPLALAMLGASASSGRAAVQQPEKKLKKSVVLGTGEKGLVKENEKKKRMMAQNGESTSLERSCACCGFVDSV
jgi:hypothetical protein